MNLLDVLVSLIMTILMAGIIMGVVQWGTEKNLQKQAAQQIDQIATAAQHYAKRHQFELLPDISSTSGVSITVQDLIDDGFLPQGYEDRNVWNQSYNIYFRKQETTVPDIAAGSGTTVEEGIRTIVLTEGGNNNSKKFQNSTVPGVIGFMPQGGGYIPSGDLPSQPAANLHGAGWSIPLASWGVPNPGSGHLGVMSSFNVTELGQDMLYRVEVPGFPELNAMQTELDMSDHAIERIKELQFVPHTMDEMADFCRSASDANMARIFKLENNGFYTCRDGEIHEILDTGNSIVVKDVRLVANGESVPKPTCAPETGSEPEIYLSQAALSERISDTRPITAFQTFATDAGSSWNIVLRLQTPENKDGSWVYPAATHAQAQAIIFCRSPRMAGLSAPAAP